MRTKDRNRAQPDHMEALEDNARLHSTVTRTAADLARRGFPLPEIAQAHFAVGLRGLVAVHGAEAVATALRMRADTLELE